MIRQIPTPHRHLYLTFDDGPDAKLTRPVLDLLNEYKIPASFFLVAQKAQTHLDITQELQRQGHSIGNHSLDHRYSVFFKGKRSLLQWISQAEETFDHIGIAQTVGFRPPAGVRTPELRQALHSLRLPLVLWNVRFYDSIWQWTPKKAVGSLRHLKAGSIILLHDVQREKNASTFLTSLRLYIEGAQAQGYEFHKLTRSLCEA